MAIALRTPIILATDDDLVRVSRDNPGHRFEREEDGTIIVSPTFTNGGAKRLEAAAQLRDHAKVAGGRAFDASTGFAIGPGKRVCAPDSAWVSQERIESLSEGQRSAFWPLSPDVAIKIKSQSDDFRDTTAKAKLFLARGGSYAVAIDPATRDVAEFGTRPTGLDFDAIIDA